jgi:hypothetical protein
LKYRSHLRGFVVQVICLAMSQQEVVATLIHPGITIGNARGKIAPAILQEEHQQPPAAAQHLSAFSFIAVGA